MSLGVVVYVGLGVYVFACCVMIVCVPEGTPVRRRHRSDPSRERGSWAKPRSSSRGKAVVVLIRIIVNNNKLNNKHTNNTNNNDTHSNNHNICYNTSECNVM